MARTVVALVLGVVLTIAVALALGTVLQTLVGGRDLGSAFGEAARQLFFFMDIGLGVWVVLLVVLAVRRRSLPGRWAMLITAAIGVLANAATVLVVSLIQGAGTAEFLGYAIGSGVAFLLAVAVVAPVIHLLFRQAPAAAPSAS